jgi:hypothetical protein
MITTNKDLEISEIISEALIKVGEKEIIQIEESQTGSTYLNVKEYFLIFRLKKECSLLMD